MEGCTTFRAKLDALLLEEADAEQGRGFVRWFTVSGMIDDEHVLDEGDGALLPVVENVHLRPSVEKR